jgi:ankyrin repeat protein
MKKYLFLLFSTVHSIHPLMTKIINFCNSKQRVVDSSLNDTLWQTIEDKDNSALQKLFIGNRIPDINCTRDDRTPLVYACANNCPEIVETLVHNGADIEKTDNKLHWTGLMWAAWMEHLSILKILYNAKANFNAQDKNGKTALM